MILYSTVQSINIQYNTISIPCKSTRNLSEYAVVAKPCKDFQIFGNLYLGSRMCQTYIRRCSIH